MVEDSEDLTKPPRRVDIARWIVAAERNMKKSTLGVNAWMRHDLEYFPSASPVVDVPLVVNVPMGEDDVTNFISDMEAGSDEDHDAGAVVSV